MRYRETNARMRMHINYVCTYANGCNETFKISIVSFSTPQELDINVSDASQGDG